MYDYSSIGKIPVQAFTNGGFVFKHKMNDLFHIFELIRVYIYDIFIFTKGYWTYLI